jgi:C-terminal processing protease CtpA/Prc
VIDLRGNGGGTDQLGIHLAERLLPGAFVYFRLSSRADDGSYGQPSGIAYGKGEHTRFLGRLVLLVDAGSFSTTDNFVRCLDVLHPDVTVVGRPTGGGTGAPRELGRATHSGAATTACTMRVYGPQSGLIEGRGTQPDVAVAWMRADWLAGRDPDLAKALAVLARGR